MSSDDLAISVSHVSKSYPIYRAPRDRLKQFLLPALQNLAGRPPKRYYTEFQALQDISFEIRRGETVGLVGRNGSGKSTLLQIICGILSPSGGRVRTFGRVAALLELGSGFNPDFTGRENVYLNAGVLGLTNSEVDARFEDIAAFADIGPFIEQPVMTYSSGMVMRLAFAVQSQINPDILIIDEALAVGDAMFQAKCFERLRCLKENGTAILLVTHACEQIVTHCSSALLLDGGRQIESGEPRRIVNRYLDMLFGKNCRPDHADETPSIPVAPKTAGSLSGGKDRFAERNGYNPYEYRWGDGLASILDFFLAAGDTPYPTAVLSGQRIRLSISIAFYRDMVSPVLGITIKTKEGVTVYGVNSENLEYAEFAALGRRGCVVRADAVFTARLAPGDYFISLGIASRQAEQVVPHDRRYDAIHLHVQPDRHFYGLADMDLTLTAKEIARQ